MKKVLLAGATGHLGQHLLRELQLQGHTVTVLARSAARAAALSPAPHAVLLADATLPEQLNGCCKGIDIVVSAIGKSISLKNKSQGSFQDIDFGANYNLLQEAKQAGVQQFVYISAFKAEQYPELAYFKAHADFSDELRKSGISYSILQPTALFSAFDEVVEMARKGMIGSLGDGHYKTNPVFEGDLAKVAVQCIGQAAATIPIGGKKLYSRLELIQLACKAADYSGAIRSVPLGVVNPMLPLLRPFSRNLYDKLAFLVAVSSEDCIAPLVGEYTLEEYFGLATEKIA
ncbi:SDR family NAD(P)-dependent oxidoreductase [Pontibacter diazotrophicus]|uniref:SDR family NAD(P)-dependent oxidoreductase n=1 Tax=Pontibacter diazotrophicus TaxID=1400979 RepID=A0A3D8LH25_9BACT|nr:SDR family oxidoreductase [Pontibacter diazotrophicus]RDV16668.1 SDR family NAD(P)-dependent oxidoreductase [Pontibacter diazotrophicus]